MHILWICGARIMGGAETTTIELLRRLRARGHAVTLLGRLGSPVEHAAADAGLAIRTAPLGAALNLRAWRAISGVLSDGAYDVALVTTIDEWVWACLARRHLGTALVLVRHMALPLSRRVGWLAGRRADAIVAVSHAVRAMLAADSTIPPHRLHENNNPVRFAPRASPPTADARARARGALGLVAPGQWVAFCGGFDPKKGIFDVAAAVQHANARVGPTNLVICGRADPRTSVSSADVLAERHQLHGRLTYLGETHHMELVLTAADVVVVATRRELSEALPTVLIEAMACGTPVLGYATGGIVEVIGTDGTAGRLAQSDDSADLGRVLSEMLRDRDAANRMAMQALERTRTTFDAERIVDAYEQLFTKIQDAS